MNEEELNELTREVLTIAQEPCLKRIAELEQQLADIKSPYAETVVAATRRVTELTNLRDRLIRVGCLNPDATDDDLVRLVRDMGIVRDAEYRCVDVQAEKIADLTKQLELARDVAVALEQELARRGFKAWLRRWFR